MSNKNFLKIAGNIHLSYYVQAADELGIKYEIVIPSLTAKFDFGKRHCYINNTVIPLNNAPSSKLARVKHFANQLMERHGVPVPKQQKLNKEIDALAFFGKFQNIVIKPSQNLGGKGVSILPKNEEEVLESFKFAKEHDRFGHVLAEEYIPGDNYRVLVLGDKVLSVIKRIPAHVTGDGNSTIQSLIEKTNEIRKQNMLMPIDVDTELMHKLASQELTLESVPDNEETVYLRSNANMSTGGTTEEVLDTVNKYYKDICVQALNALDLEYAGVDLITPDITKEAKCAINEVNFNPGLRLHYKISNGTPQHVALPVMKYIKEKYSA